MLVLQILKLKRKTMHNGMCTFLFLTLAAGLLLLWGFENINNQSNNRSLLHFSVCRFSFSANK